MPSLRARLADRLIWLAGEFYTTDPRGPQVRGILKKIGVDIAPYLKLPGGWRKLLAGAELPWLRRVESSTAVNFGGVPCHVFNEAGASRGTVVYFHGGGFIGGSLASHGTLVQALAFATQRRTIFVDYRLGPEHRHPAALDDGIAVWQALLAAGLEPQAGTFMGDSAGGNLTLSVPLKLLELGHPLPGALVALSPVTDVTLSGASMVGNRNRDAMLCAADIKLMADAYAASPADLVDPLLSPLFADAKRLAQLPPLLIQVSDAEVLLDDARRFAAKMAQAGGDVTLNVWPDLPHVWQAFTGLVPEADHAIAELATWLDTNECIALP